MPPIVVEQVTNGNQDPGVTTIYFPDGSNPPPHVTPDIAAVCRDAELEVCFVCKKCKIAFTTDANLLSHQRQCFHGNMELRGAYRIVQNGIECKFCPNEKFKNAIEFKKHAETDLHVKCIKNGPPAPSESPLIHEMEDVVNQITLLAARAAQETGGDGVAAAAAAAAVLQQQRIDSNSNTFCQPGDPKRRFLNPQDVAQSLTSAGH